MNFNRNHPFLSQSLVQGLNVVYHYIHCSPFTTHFWLFFLDLSPIRSWTWAPILHGWKSQFDKLWIWSPFIQANDTFPGRMLWSQHLILLQLQVAGDFHANTLFFYSSFNAWNFCSGHNYHWNHLVTISTSLLSSITKII